MTDPTPMTTPTPPQGLTDEQLLELAEKELCIDDTQDAHEQRYPLEVVTDELLAFARAAIAADRANRPTITGIDLSVSLQIDESTESIKQLCDGLAAAVKPNGGYAAAKQDDLPPSTGCEQMVQVEWWIPQYGCDSLQLTLDAIKGRILVAVRDWWATALTTTTHEAARAQLPPNYIDPEHTGEDRKLLEAFYVACRAEGGTADEITLRGIRAVIVADRANHLRDAAKMVPTPEDVESPCWAWFQQGDGMPPSATEVPHAAGHDLPCLPSEEEIEKIAGQTLAIETPGIHAFAHQLLERFAGREPVPIAIAQNFAGNVRGMKPAKEVQ